jgi:hypothetical protein
MSLQKTFLLPQAESRRLMTTIAETSVNESAEFLRHPQWKVDKT